MHRTDAEVLAVLGADAPPPSLRERIVDVDDSTSAETTRTRPMNQPRRRAPVAVRRALVGLLPLAAFLAVSSLSSLLPGRTSSFESRRLSREAPPAAVPRVLLKRLANLGSPPSADDIPVFWHVLKSGGTTVHDLSAVCLGLSVASEVGALEGHGDEKTLAVVEVNEGQRHVNVDTTVLPGIVRAGELGLGSSGLADVVFTPLLIDTAEHVFDRKHRGMMFALIRHPVYRVISQFYYLSRATWEPTYNPLYANMTVQEWAQTPYVESNWMVRSLVGKMEAPLTKDDIEAAKYILRKKCLVGLLDEMDESVMRFRKYFGFGTQGAGSRDQAECVRNMTIGEGGKGSNHNTYSSAIEPGDDTWKTLKRKNNADMHLYQYAKVLFEEQRSLVEGKLNVVGAVKSQQ